MAEKPSLFSERVKAMRRRTQPDPNSRRSNKRRKRNFVSLEVSSRKHRRANERHLISRTIGNSLRDPGATVDGPHGFSYRAGGAFNYH